MRIRNSPVSKQYAGHYYSCVARVSFRVSWRIDVGHEEAVFHWFSGTSGDKTPRAFHSDDLTWHFYCSQYFLRPPRHSPFMEALWNIVESEGYGIIIKRLFRCVWRYFISIDAISFYVESITVIQARILWRFSKLSLMISEFGLRNTF